MLTTKRLAAVLFPLCTILAAPPAHAEEESAPAKPAPMMKAGEVTIGSGAFVFAVAYMMGIVVSLSADTNCQGSICNERYLSFVPVFGGILQFSVAGRSFHDEHHSDNCFPLTVADVTGQAVGVVGIATGLVMRYVAHKSESNVNVTPTFERGAPGAALSVRF